MNKPRINYCNHGQLNLWHMKADHKAFRNFWVWPKKDEMGLTYTSDTDSLSFWPIYHRQLTDIPLTINGPRIGRVLVTYNIDRDICQQSVDMSTITWPISRSIHRSIRWHTCISASFRPRVGQYVNQHIGRHSADMSTDTLVECLWICQPIYRLRVAQNTHDPKN